MTLLALTITDISAIINTSLYIQPSQFSASQFNHSVKENVTNLKILNFFKSTELNAASVRILLSNMMGQQVNIFLFIAFRASICH